MTDSDAAARMQTLDILTRTGAGGFTPKVLNQLKDAMVEHVQGGGSLEKSFSVTNHSMSYMTPSIRLTLALVKNSEEVE